MERAWQGVALRDISREIAEMNTTPPDLPPGGSLRRRLGIVAAVAALAALAAWALVRAWPVPPHP